MAAIEKVLAELVLLLERKHALAIGFHADHGPAVLLRLVIERGSKGANLAVRQTLCWTVGILAGAIVVQHQHLQPRAGTCAGPLQHLAIACRVAERRMRPAAD